MCKPHKNPLPLAERLCLKLFYMDLRVNKHFNTDLSSMMARVIIYRHRGYTRKVIAERLGITSERVRQRENKFQQAYWRYAKRGRVFQVLNPGADHFRFVFDKTTDKLKRVFTYVN